jgi:hypothetical protein
VKLLLLASLLLSVGCTTTRYTLTKSAGRELLLPPGVRPPKVSSDPETGCGKTGTPITPRASHYSVYGCYIQDGFVDLRPEMRLKVIKPVLPDGESLRVQVLSQSERDRTVTVKTNATGVETKVVEASSLGLGADITHYRLFFLARDLGRERKITLIGANSARALEDASTHLEDHCQKPLAACIAVTDGMAIAPLIPVNVAGKLEYVPLGASLRELIPKGAERVKLFRQWQGKLVAVRTKGREAPPLSSLPLNGGDHVSW